MDKYEQYLEKGGRVVGNAIGWGLRRLWDSLRNASEKSREGAAPRPGDPNRILPSWEMEVCERSVKKALAYLPDPVAGAIKQSARQLCIDLLLYLNVAPTKPWSPCKPHTVRQPRNQAAARACRSSS